MDVSIRSTDTVNEDQTWLGNGGMPIGQPRSIVLDRSAFDFDADFPDGYLPSGIVLAEITATGLYGPYDNAGAGGLETAAGHLFASIPVDENSTGDLAAALFWSGEVIEANLPTGHGLDASAKTDLAAHIAYV